MSTQSLLDLASRTAIEETDPQALYRINKQSFICFLGDYNKVTEQPKV